MDDSPAVVWTVASVAGSLMWTERKIRGAWGCFAASFFPMFVATIVWAPMSQNHFWQYAIPGIIGAITGAILLIGITQIMHRTASAQSTQSPCSAGANNTIVGDAPCNLGDGNTIINQADANGNVILNRGGTAIGKDACADSSSIAVGAGANAGQCVQPRK